MKNRFLFLSFGLAVLLFAGWAIYSGSKAGGWGGLVAIWPIVLVGVLAVGALTGALMWLAFYSADHGYDDPPGSSDPPEDAQR